MKNKHVKVKENLKDSRRSAEILGVFARHNFYVNGFTPEELRTTLEDLGPTYIKIGQIMSSRFDLLPEAYCRELEKLRSDVSPLDPEFVREVILRETGKCMGEIYREFHDEPLGAASIAQAHYGVLLDGTKVVTKVQRPMVADMMRKDFILLKKLAGMIGMAGEADETQSTIDFGAVIRELEKVTEEELDFRIEADNTRKFRELCIEDEIIVSCPEIIDELTTERMLTMTYVDGYSISHADRVDADGYDRKAIGEALLSNYLHQVLDAGVFHGDPHQGNIMISDGVPYWIDFGMMGRISDERISNIQDLVLALFQQDTEALTNAVLALGKINGKINKAKLTDDVDGLIAKYMSAKNPLNIDAGILLSDVTDILKAHRISVPGELTMLIRSLVTLEGVLVSFCPELNFFDYLVKKLIQRAKENFDVKEQLTAALESLAVNGLRAARLPGLASDVLRNLVKGRLKISFELTGYEEPLRLLGETLRYVILAVFACVLFSGSCTLCTTGIQPQANGVPVVAMIGFIVSIAMASFTIKGMVKRNR